MKKNANRVIILAVIISLIILIGALGFKVLFLDGVVNETREIFNDVESTNDKIDDVEGWGIIAKSATGSIAGGMYIFLLIFFVVMPVLISIFSATWCLLGRLFLIGKEEKWKYNVFRFFIIIYDVLMIIILRVFSIFSNYTLILAIPILVLLAYNFYLLFMKKIQNTSENIVVKNPNNR